MSGKRRLKRSKAGITAGVLFFTLAVVFIILLIRTLTGTSIADGLIPISIIFAGFAVAFTISGIFTFACDKFIRKVIITFFITVPIIIVGVVTAVAVMVRVWGTIG